MNKISLINESSAVDRKIEQHVDTLEGLMNLFHIIVFFVYWKLLILISFNPSNPYFMNHQTKTYLFKENSKFGLVDLFGSRVIFLLLIGLKLIIFLYILTEFVEGKWKPWKVWDKPR